ERVETLTLDIALMLCERFQTRYICPHKSIFDALKEEQLVFLDRTTDSDSRRRGADAVELSIAPARSRQHAKKQVTKIVTSRARLDRRHRTSKLSKLRRVRI